MPFQEEGIQLKYKLTLIIQKEQWNQLMDPEKLKILTIQELKD